MSTLITALERLGLQASIELDGRWVAIPGERGTAYVIEAGWGSSFYVWCDIPEERAVKRYADAMTAVQEGVRRAGGQSPSSSDNAPPATT